MTYTLTLPDGGTMSYSDSHPDTRAEASRDEPRRPLVVLLHAGYLDRRMWEDDIPWLSADHRVVAPDARGHGQSADVLSSYRACDDVAELIRALDAGPATLVGISMGAGVAIETAVEHPDRVNALIVSGVTTTPPRFTDPWTLDILARQHHAIANADAEGWLRATLDYAPGPHRTLADMTPGVVERLGTMQRGFLAHVRPGVAPPQPLPHAWERLNRIDAPLLAISGLLDSPDHHRMTQQLVDQVAGDTRVLHLPNAGHFANMDDPSHWREGVLTFLHH